MRLTLHEFCVGAVVVGALATPLVIALVLPVQTEPDPRVGYTWISGRFIHVAGNAWQTVLPKQLDEMSDSSETPTRSKLQLYENEKPIGPPHSRHTDIIDKGGGLYSHWRVPSGASILIFSATDNSNPNWNWKRYSYRLQQ